MMNNIKAAITQFSQIFISHLNDIFIASLIGIIVIFALIVFWRTMVFLIARKNLNQCKARFPKNDFSKTITSHDEEIIYQFLLTQRNFIRKKVRIFKALVNFSFIVGVFFFGVMLSSSCIGNEEFTIICSRILLVLFPISIVFLICERSYYCIKTAYNWGLSYLNNRNIVSTELTLNFLLQRLIEKSSYKRVWINWV